MHLVVIKADDEDQFYVTKNDCDWDKIKFQYFSDKRCYDEVNKSTDDYDIAESFTENMEKNNTKVFPFSWDDSCQYIDGNWYQWQCDDDKMELVQFEDMNKFTDQDFARRQILKQ